MEGKKPGGIDVERRGCQDELWSEGLKVERNGCREECRRDDIGLVGL